MLDEVHHVAIQVRCIGDSMKWYKESFNCEIEYQDDSWALIKFNNMYLALVLAEQHPYHFAIVQEGIDRYGEPIPHRDGTRSVYIKDPDGNNVEMLELAT
ncbi:VOC family protein [Parvularcula sp. IMCC14364]|uniref:VOC family protein n=1 Tax=Parvularcula sp. IMCC14364 TaxID=3067902 RepID=UPI00274194B0|nr:VOC family protein [Parvularcula sp. IMCC14364]